MAASMPRIPDLAAAFAALLAAADSPRSNVAMKDDARASHCTRSPPLRSRTRYS